MSQPNTTNDPQTKQNTPSEENAPLKNEPTPERAAQEKKRQEENATKR